jgi:hypothetical protein
LQSYTKCEQSEKNNDKALKNGMLPSRGWFHEYLFKVKLVRMVSSLIWTKPYKKRFQKIFPKTEYNDNENSKASDKCRILLKIIHGKPKSAFSNLWLDQ